MFRFVYFFRFSIFLVFLFFFVFLFFYFSIFSFHLFVYIHIFHYVRPFSFFFRLILYILIFSCHLSFFCKEKLKFIFLYILLISQYRETHYLLPALTYGPNNQLRGFRESLILSIITNRTLIIPPFFKHTRNDPTIERKTGNII